MNLGDRIKVGAVGLFKRIFGQDGFAAEVLLSFRLEFSNLFLRCRLAFIEVRFAIRDAFYQFRIRRLKRCVARMIGKTTVHPQNGQCADDDNDARRRVCEKKSVRIAHCCLRIEPPNSRIEQRAA